LAGGHGSGGENGREGDGRGQNFWHFIFSGC
jgi:hypothetical protein